MDDLERLATSTLMIKMFRISDSSRGGYEPMGEVMVSSADDREPAFSG